MHFFYNELKPFIDQYDEEYEKHLRILAPTPDARQQVPVGKGAQHKGLIKGRLHHLHLKNANELFDDVDGVVLVAGTRAGRDTKLSHSTFIVQTRVEVREGGTAKDGQ